MVEVIEEKEFVKEVKKVQWVARLLNYWTMKKYTLSVDIKAWEIFEIDFGMNVGHEFSGRHYGVVIHDSPYYNPLITVIPIKTAKKEINLNSDVLLNKIEGIRSSKKSIAVINQIQTVDKLRIFNVDSINFRESNQPLKLNETQINDIKKGLLKILLKM